MSVEFKTPISLEAPSASSGDPAPLDFESRLEQKGMMLEDGLQAQYGDEDDATGLFEDQHVHMNITAAVPRLDDLVVKTLAENYDIYPAFDRIPPEYLDNVVALLDPSQIDFVVAAKYIQTEKFWKRLCLERWPIFKTQEHGLSYKRLYIERHLQALLESYFPSKDGENYERLLSEVKQGAPFVHTIKIQQLLSHVDVAQIMNEFPYLSTLKLTYGARKLGMDYSKALFGMQHPDAMNLAKFLHKTKSLTTVILRENLLNDESIQILVSGLRQNWTVTTLDLSQNKIGPMGAKRLCALLEKNRCLTDLNLAGNNINEDGARALGAAIASSNSLLTLSLRLNPLGDLGGQHIIEGTEFNTSLRTLDLGACDLQARSTAALGSLLLRNNTLTTIDVTSNEIAGDGAQVILHALNKFNTKLIRLDLRRNPIAKTVGCKEIQLVLKKRLAESKRARRKLYQNGWDEAM